MPRPPDISEDALNNLRKFRTELQSQAETRLTLEDALTALLENGIRDTGELAADGMDRIVTDITDHTNRP